MAGLPPLGGFLSKELFYEGVLEADLFLTTLAVTASCLTFLYSFIFFHGMFSLRPPIRLSNRTPPLTPSIIPHSV